MARLLAPKNKKATEQETQALRSRQRRRRLRVEYNMTLGQYREMYLTQGGLCALCGKPETNGNLLVVDHDHDTGKVRGLLCSGCNLEIGKMENFVKRHGDNIKFYQARGRP